MTMKLTVATLRKIIREEVEGMTQGKKKGSSADAFDAALADAEKSYKPSPRVENAANKSLKALKAGSKPEAVVRAASAATSYDTGRGRESLVDLVIDAVAAEDAAAGAKLQAAYDNLYASQPGSVGYEKRFPGTR
jgi:hypothetical protein